MRSTSKVGVFAAAVVCAACQSSGNTPGFEGGGAGSFAPTAGMTGGIAGASGGPAMGASGTGVSTGMSGTPGSGSSGTPAMGSGGMIAAAGKPAAGAGGSAGMSTAGMGAAGSMAGSGTAGSAPMLSKSPCITAGSEVVFIGDSYCSYGVAHTDMNVLMAQRAVMGGALMSGQRYRSSCVPGTTLASGGGSIPPQWNSEKATKPIKLVIMDGGGNDVLIDNMQCLNNGSSTNTTCIQVVEASLAKGKELWADMKATGVTDVIWYWYPHPPVGGEEINDYALKKLQDAAAAATTADFHVYMVDTIPLFTGHDDYFYFDGIHANDTGQNVIADAVWKLMKDKCIGQAASSMCCAM